MFQTKFAEKIKIHILCLLDFFSKNRAIYEIMWKNMLEQDRTQMAICYDACALHAGRLSLQYSLRMCKGRCTLSVKLSDFTVWRHTWRKNWVNYAVLTDNSAGLRTVLSIRVLHTEQRSSLGECHSFLGLPVLILDSHTHKKTHRTDKKTDKPYGKPVLCQRTFSSVFRTVFLHS
jgi:hypothetical protein